MKNKKLSRISNIITLLFAFVSILFIIWFIASVVDVNLHNEITESITKSDWNLFYINK